MTGLRRLVLAGIVLVAIALIINPVEGKKHKKGGERHKNHENEKEWKDGAEKNTRQGDKVSEKGKKEKYYKKDRKEKKASLSEEPLAVEEVSTRNGAKQEKKLKQGKPKTVENEGKTHESKKVKRSVKEERKPDSNDKNKEEVMAPEGACESASTKENYRKPSEDVCRQCAQEREKEEAANAQVESSAEEETVIEDVIVTEVEEGENVSKDN